MAAFGSNLEFIISAEQDFNTLTQGVWDRTTEDLIKLHNNNYEQQTMSVHIVA